MKTHSLFIAFLFIILANTATPAAARTPRGRTITGTIQKVDAQAQEVEMLRYDTGTLISFVWIARTTFAAKGRMTDAAILKKGAHVEVSYHEPVFGKPFVTRVALLPTPSATTQPTARTK